MKHNRVFDFKTEGEGILNVLIKCEESQEVMKAFRELGHNAFSNDLLPCSGGFPEYHFQCDHREAERKMKWDLIICFPPCTDLAVSGARYFEQKRKDGRQQQSIDLFMSMFFSDCPVAVENPIGIMSSHFRKPDQIIQPWQFGHGETKATCLWLQGLPKLEPTNIVEGREQRIWKMPPSKDRAKLRSKTYTGIAKAMALQWSLYLRGGVLKSNTHAQTSL